MASTEPASAVVIEPLTAADLASALALSKSAHWNQNEADWLMMLALGRGWGIRDRDGDGPAVLAASTIALPYGQHFAWLSMVLVLPAFQRRGHASRLLRHALAELGSEGRHAVLDATPAGHAVYVQEGFGDGWAFARYRRAAALDSGSRRADLPVTRPLRDDDWPAIDALDVPVFGASRLALLQTLARRLPAAAHVVEQGGQVRGYVLGRDGRTAIQIGPLVAADTESALALLGAALAAVQGPVVVDLLDERPALRQALEDWGFVFERPFTRMVTGGWPPPGQREQLMLVAGPELG